MKLLFLKLFLNLSLFVTAIELEVMDLDHLLTLDEPRLNSLLSNTSFVQMLNEDVIFDLLAFEVVQNDIIINNLKQRLMDFTEETNNLDTTTPVSDLVESIPNFDHLLNYDSLELDLGLEYMDGKEIADILNKYTDKQILQYLKNMKSDQVLTVASKTGVFENLNMNKIILLSSQLNILKKINPKIILKLAHRNPNLLGSIPLKSLEVLIQRTDFISSLDLKVIISQFKNSKVSHRLSLLPNKVLRQFIIKRPDVLPQLVNQPDSNFLKMRAMKLLRNVSFLETIPLAIHVFLAEDKLFSSIMTPRIILSILKAKPDLPKSLDSATLHYFIDKYFYSKYFIDSLPCSVILTNIRDVSFVESLEPELIRSLSKNSHIYDCLSSTQLGTLIMNTNIGEKLGIRDSFYAFLQIYREQPNFLTKDNLWKVVRYQVPSITKSYIYWS